MTRRTKFVLGAVAMFVATAVAVIAILIGSNSTSPGGPASSTAPTGPVGVQRLTAELKAADSTPVATATFDFSYGRATVTVKTVQDGVLTPGFHALQIHAVGKARAQLRGADRRPSPVTFILRVAFTRVRDTPATRPAAISGSCRWPRTGAQL